MKVAGLQLQHQHQQRGHSSERSPGPSPSGPCVEASAGLFSPAASGAGTCGERTGSNRGHASPDMMMSESPQGEVARLVGQILEGGLQSNLSEAARGISGPAAATLQQLQSRLGELTAPQGDSGASPVVRALPGLLLGP